MLRWKLVFLELVVVLLTVPSAKASAKAWNQSSHAASGDPKGFLFHREYKGNPANTPYQANVTHGLTYRSNRSNEARELVLVGYQDGVKMALDPKSLPTKVPFRMTHPALP